MGTVAFKIVAFACIGTVFNSFQPGSKKKQLFVLLEQKQSIFVAVVILCKNYRILSTKWCNEPTDTNLCSYVKRKI